MRYVFIVNPKAGAHNRTEEVRRQAEDFFCNDKNCYKIYETAGRDDATKIALEESNKGDPVRIYGFGGDGTLLEIVRGAEGHANAEVGIFPTGSGNDYVRTYGEKAQFLDFGKQIRGKSIAVDMIDTQNGKALNICSVGLDAKVAYEMAAFKRLPGIKGSLAYDMALIKCLMGRLGDRLTIRLKTQEGEKKLYGEYLFVLAAVGKWYGGGYMGAPKAVTNDGLLDFIMIKKPPLHKIPAMVRIYKKGQHLESPLFREYLSVYKGSELELESAEKICCNRDGECDQVKRERFSLSKGSLRFILPQGVEYGVKPMDTGRLILRNWRDEDFADYCAYALDSSVMVPAGNRICKKPEDAATGFKRMVEDRLCFAIEHKKSGHVIGSITLQQDVRRWRVNSKAVGYELNQVYWGQGYMPEALQAVIAYGFEELDLEALAVSHFAGNEKSRRVIEKCGFTYEGTIRKGFRRLDGELFDDLCYSITKEDYKKHTSLNEGKDEHNVLRK